jgi:hypothetical protein
VTLPDAINSGRRTVVSPPPAVPSVGPAGLPPLHPTPKKTQLLLDDLRPCPCRPVAQRPGPAGPQSCRRRPPRQGKIFTAEPTYAAYKRAAPLLAAPHPSHEPPVALSRTATPPIAPPPPISTAGRPLPRRHLLEPSLAKVSTVVASPRPPPSFPPISGRHRPREHAAPPPDRGRRGRAPPVLCLIRRGEGGRRWHFCQRPPVSPLFLQTEPFFLISLYSSQLSP